MIQTETRTAQPQLGVGFTEGGDKEPSGDSFLSVCMAKVEKLRRRGIDLGFEGGVVEGAVREAMREHASYYTLYTHFHGIHLLEYVHPLCMYYTI